MSITDPSRLADRQNIRNATFEAGEAKTLAQQTAVIAGGLITRSPAPPSGAGVADGALWLETGVDGIVIHQWDEATTAWVAADLDPTVIASAIIGQLAAGVIDTTEVTIRSGETGARIVLDGTGLRGYNAANQLKTNVGSDGTLVAEDATIEGLFRAGKASSPGIVIRQHPASGTPTGGVVEFDGPSSVGAAVYFRTNRISVNGAQLSGGSGFVDLTGSSNGDGEVNIVGSGGSSAGYTGTVNIRAKAPGASGTGNVNLTGTVNFTDTATKQSARNSLGLGNTTGALPVANGGTGATTAAAARANLGLYGVATWDTGWVSYTSGSWNIVRRRSGPMVEVRWDYSASLAAGAIVNAPVAAIPLDMRPSGINAAGSALTYANGASLHAEVTTAGAIAVKNSGDSAATSHRGQAVYFLGAP